MAEFDVSPVETPSILHSSELLPPVRYCCPEGRKRLVFGSIQLKLLYFIFYVLK